MRLLHLNNDGGFILTEFFEENIPTKYAILSHRWGSEEVIYKDIMEGTGKGKAGYAKIKFCGERAKRDGLKYFWVDTCCIDKSSSAELQESINSMFCWYRKSTKCYVYLPDVSQPRTSSTDRSKNWLSAFLKSKWFTRGWTLQELIAPASVDFFSKEGELLGNKTSLGRYIRDITGIPSKALRGTSLSDFSVNERLSWAAGRETFRPEDMVYSLFGIFGVSLTIIYSEGRKNALQRLLEEVNRKNNEVPFVLDSKFTSRGKVRQEKKHWREKQRLVNGSGRSSTLRVRSGLRCYRCDNPHLLGNCYANLDTVSQARDRRMDSDRCVNCGSEEHWERDCDWEDLR